MATETNQRVLVECMCSNLEAFLSSDSILDGKLFLINGKELLLVNVDLYDSLKYILFDTLNMKAFTSALSRCVMVETLLSNTSVMTGSYEFTNDLETLMDDSIIYSKDSIQCHLNKLKEVK